MQSLSDWIKEIKANPLKIGETKHIPIIQQTFRNSIRQSLMDALTTEFQNLESIDGVTVNRISDGVAITIDHPDLANVDGCDSGMFTIIVAPEFKDLTYEITDAIDDYELRLQQKAASKSKHSATKISEA